MTEIKLTKRYPLSRTEDITDAYMRGWNDALDAVQNGKFHIAEQTEPNSKVSETPTSSEKPNNCDEPQTENLFTDKYGDVWEWRGDAWYCISGQDEPQTDCAWK